MVIQLVYSVTLISYKTFNFKAHNAEVAFYKMVQECKIAISVPKMYFGESFTDASSQGLLAFEDVGDKAATIPIYQTLTIDEVKQVLVIV